MTDISKARNSPRSTIERIGAEVLVIHLAGWLELPDLMHRLIERGAVAPFVVLDLANVPQLDADRIAVLTGAQARLSERGSRLALWRLRAQPKHLLRQTQGFHVIDTLDGDLDGHKGGPSNDLGGVRTDIAHGGPLGPDRDTARPRSAAS